MCSTRAVDCGGSGSGWRLSARWLVVCFAGAMLAGVGVVLVAALLVGGEDCEETSSPDNRFYTSYLLDCDNDNTTDLVMLHLVWRHGSRSPIESGTYPLDPYANEQFYPYGRGNLIKPGYVGSYELGVFIRRRYGDFLGNVVNPKVVSLQSSDKQRTRDSAALVMGGLFPAPPEMQWSTTGLGRIWVPFTAQVWPFRKDHLLATADSDCPLRTTETARVLASPEVAAEDATVDPAFLQYVSANTGMVFKDATDLPAIYDALHGQSDYGLPLPEWAQAVYPQPLKFYANLGYNRTSFSPLLQKLLGGPLLHEVLNVSRRWGSDSGDPEGSIPAERRLFAYSTHDNVIMAMLKALQATEPGHPRQPPYCSLLAFELHRNRASGELGLKVIFRNSTTEPPHILAVPSCGHSFCSLERFSEALKYFLISPDEQRALCYSEQPT